MSRLRPPPLGPRRARPGDALDPGQPAQTALKKSRPGLAGGDEDDNEPESVKRYRQFLAGSTMPPDLRSAATGDIDSTMLETSTSRLLLQSWLPDGGSTHVLAQRTPAHAPVPQMPQSTPDFARGEEMGMHRAGRGPSFALSPVLPPQGDSPKSQSWLNAQPVINSPQANWLSSAAVPDTAPDTARSNASANWLQAHDPKSEQLEPQHSDSSSSASARTVPAQAHGTRKRASRPLNAADGAPNARRAGALPPLPLTLPPLPLTPTSTTSKESARALTLSGATTQSKGTESGTGARSERPDDAQFAHSDEGKSRGSGGSTPITPSDDPDQDDFQGVHPDSLRDSLRQAVIGPLMLASASQEGQRGRQSKGASAKRGFNVQPQQDNAVPQNQSHLIENGRARDAMSTQGNGHASAAHHRQSFTWGDQTSKGGDDQMIGPPFLNVASHARERDDGNSSPQSLEDADPLRKPHRFGSNKMRSSDSLSKLGIAIREHLNHAHFACGFVADTDQSARQRRAYEFYFSSWKRCLVSSVVLVHSALAFAELSTSADVRAEVMWRAADAWMQALHFLCVLVYLADATLLAIGLTVANLDPRRNSRNATCLLLTLAVAADTLLTAMMVETSSFSLPLRACLLVPQMPGAVRVFKMWVQAVLNLGSLFLSIFFVMLCLAALAVIGIRELCPHRTCFPGADCPSTPPECQSLLSHCSDFPSALVILWNLAGGAGHVDNLTPFLDASVAFGILYFVLSSAVCMVWFRFVWLAATWHCLRDVSRREVLDERRKFILLLDSAFQGDRYQNVPLRALAPIVSCVWPSLTVRQSLKALQQCFGCENGPRVDSIPRQHVGALAWLLHANARVGLSLPEWVTCSFITPLGQDKKGEHAEQKRSLPRTLTRFMHFCAVLSFSMLIASAWLPDPGSRCINGAEEDHSTASSWLSRDSECAANRGLEWLDVLICGAFCVEIAWILMLKGRAVVARLKNVYRILDVTTEVLMILTLFRDQGMGNKAMVVRLLRAPRLVFIIQRLPVFNFWLQFTITTLVGAAQMFVIGLTFVFFFGTVTWQAVVFSGARSAGAALDFNGLSSACYTVFLVVLGEDWHAHTRAIFDAVDSNSQRFGFVLLFLAQWIGGQTLLYVFCAAAWSSATLEFGDNGLTLTFKEFSTGAEQKGRGSDLFLAYAHIEACRVLQRSEGGVSGLDSSMPASCISMYVQQCVITLDIPDDDLAMSWAADIRMLSRNARMEFSLDATVRSDEEDLMGDLVQKPSQLSTGVNRKDRCGWIRRRCTVFDFFTHEVDLPALLPVCTISMNTNPCSNGNLPHSDSNVSLRSSPKQPQQPASSGNEMSCRTNTTPKATPRKLSSQSPRHTPRDSRVQRDLMDVAAFSSDDDAAKEQMIAAIEMFKGLRPGDANALAGQMRVLTVRPESPIIREGELGHMMIRVLHGVAKQRYGSTVTCTLDPGAMCGHRELFENESSANSKISVWADTECRCVVLTKDALLGLLQARASLLAKLKDNATYLDTRNSWLMNLSEGTDCKPPPSPLRAGKMSTSAGRRNGRRKVSEAKQLGVTLLSNGPAPVLFTDMDTRAMGSKAAAMDAPSNGTEQELRANGSPPSGGLPAAGSASPATPAVMREKEAAYLNNNVVLPPGANVRLASELDALSPQHETPQEEGLVVQDVPADSWT